MKLYGLRWKLNFFIKPAMVGNVSSELEETTVGAVSYSLGNQAIVNPLPSSNIT